MYPNTTDSGIDKIVPLNLLVVRSGTYQDQHIRTWDFNGTFEHVNNLAETIVQRSLTKITPDLMAASAPNILTVSTGTGGIAPVANGWGTARGIFLLSLDVHYITGGVVRWIVQGYTDEDSFSEVGCSASTLFTINTIFSYTKATMMVNGINTSRLSLNKSYQVLNGQAPAMPGVASANNLLIRPEDVMSNIMNKDLFQADTMVRDTTQLMGHDLQTSRTSNNVPSRMLSETMNEWFNATNEGAMISTTGSIAEATFGRLVEEKPANDIFINMLAKSKDRFGGNKGTFTFKQLEAAMPGIHTVSRFLRAPKEGVRNSTRDESITFGGASIENIIVDNLKAIIPSIMIESLISTVSFVMTNYQGHVEVRPLGISAFDPVIDKRQWEIFQGRLIREVAPMFTNRGHSFATTISCSFFHEITITLELDGRTVDARAPAFANNSFTPIQTPSFEVSREFSDMFENVAMTLGDAMMQSSVTQASRIESAMTNIAPSGVPNSFVMPEAVNVNYPAQPPVHGGSMLGQIPGFSQEPATPQRKPSSGGMLDLI